MSQRRAFAKKQIPLDPLSTGTGSGFAQTQVIIRGQRFAREWQQRVRARGI